MTQHFCFSHTNLKSRRPETYFLAFLNFFSCGKFCTFLVFFSSKIGKTLKNCVLRGWQCRFSRCLVSSATSSLFLFSVPQASIWRSHLICPLCSVLALFHNVHDVPIFRSVLFVLILLRFLKKIHKMHRCDNWKGRYQQKSCVWSVCFVNVHRRMICATSVQYVLKC